MDQSKPNTNVYALRWSHLGVEMAEHCLNFLKPLSYNGGAHGQDVRKMLDKAICASSVGRGVIEKVLCYIS